MTTLAAPIALSALDPLIVPSALLESAFAAFLDVVHRLSYRRALPIRFKYYSMRFLANGPSIPDDLLIARDAGDVIFFCGAGVSRHCAGLPDFLKLGGDVIDLLGAGERSLARTLFRRVKELDPISGVGGLVATDRIFSLLEREFEKRHVQNAVAHAIKPSGDPDLSAHRTLIDLSRGRDGTVRLGSRLIEFQSQNKTVAARAMAEKNVSGHRS